MDPKLIEKRKLELDNFVNESFAVNTDFASRLGLENPFEILMNFESLKDFMFTTVHNFMKHQKITSEDRVWMITRLGYLLGEYFKEKYAGYWTVNEAPDSPQYGHYVIHAKSPSGNAHYPINVFGAATELVEQEDERDLIQLVTEIEAVIQ
ncbi:MAG: hypothetical protein MK212_09080 [Saprospiraceae bacterium]|nr:hypothetical protein [Saprospiraceae bacterium]